MNLYPPLAAFSRGEHSSHDVVPVPKAESVTIYTNLQSSSHIFVRVRWLARLSFRIRRLERNGAKSNSDYFLCFSSVISLLATSNSFPLTFPGTYRRRIFTCSTEVCLTVICHFSSIPIDSLNDLLIQVWKYHTPIT